MDAVNNVVSSNRTCLIDRMDDGDFTDVQAWLRLSFHTDVRVRSIGPQLGLKLSEVMGKGDAGTYEDVSMLVYAFFNEHMTYSFPSRPSFNIDVTGFGRTRRLWFQLLKEREHRDKNTFYVEDSRVLNAMDSPHFDLIRAWLQYQSTTGRTREVIAGLLRGQIELGLFDDKTRGLRCVESIADNFFVPETVFAKSPFIFRTPVSQTRFAQLRLEWFQLHGLEES